MDSTSELFVVNVHSCIAHPINVTSSYIQWGLSKRDKLGIGSQVSLTVATALYCTIILLVAIIIMQIHPQ